MNLLSTELGNDCLVFCSNVWWEVKNLPDVEEQLILLFK